MNTKTCVLFLEFQYVFKVLKIYIFVILFILKGTFKLWRKYLKLPWYVNYFFYNFWTFCKNIFKLLCNSLKLCKALMYAFWSCLIINIYNEILSFLCIFPKKHFSLFDIAWEIEYLQIVVLTIKIMPVIIFLLIFNLNVF